MDDEFKTVGNELNKPIAEFQQLEAMEYYPINEAVAAPLENLGVNEDLTDDSGTKANEAAGKSRIETAQERLDNVNRITNTADGVRSPSLDMNAAAEADAEAAVAEASASAGVTVTSTVASLAGTVSVVAVAAAAVVSVAGGLIEKEPSLVSENYEVGTNYIKYEIDIEELSENMDYKIKVSNPNFEIEYPILEAGLQRQIVPDLLPYRRYDLEIIGTDPNVGDIVYYKRECYTDILTKPKAVFKFTPHFDYILGRLDLEYETYISNFYNNADNTYLQIYSGDRLVLEDKELPEDNFFRGTIYNLGSADAIRAVAYTDWFNGAFTVPNTEIGTFGYEIDVPDDFEFKNVFTGTYTFGTECFSKSFDLESGTNLAIDTNFKTTDSNEAYRIDVYNKDEIIKSVTSSDEIVNINLDSYLRNIDLKFTPIKYDGDEITEYEPTIVKKYDIDPKIFSEIAFYQYEGGIYFDSRVSDEFKEKMEQKPITLKIVKNFIDGTSLEVSNIVELIDGEYISYEGGITDEQDKTLADVLSFDISLTYGDTLIEKFNSPTISNATLGTADVDDDGNIIIPFELDLSSMEDVKVEPYIDERDLEIEYDGKNGTIIVSELESNIVNVELRISYVVDGVTTYATQMIEEYNLGADYEVSYFVSHVGSFYTQLDIKYDATINGKNANINLYPVVTKDELELESTGSYLDYYVFEYGEGEYNITYKLGNYGFDAEEVTIPVNSSMPFYDSNMESLNIGYYDTFTNEVFVYYTKTYNEDGTVNYIFDVPFEDNGGNHYARIEGAYEEDGVTKYICTDLVTSDWKLLNVPDYDYSLGIRPYYRTSDGILYDLSINNNSILKTKELSDLYVESETYLGALVNEDDEDNPTLDAVLDFNFRTKSLDLSKNLTLIYYGKEYQIDIIEPTEELVSGNDAYFESFDYRYYSAIKYTITKDGYGYTVVYYKESGDYKYDRLMVEFFIIDGGKELDKDASVIYYTNNGTESISKEVRLINNTITYDKDKIELSYEEDDDYNIVTVNIPDYHTRDTNYYLKCVAYYNGRELDYNNLYDNNYCSFYVEKGYTNIEFKLLEIKNQSVESINYNTTQDDNNLILNANSIGSIELPTPLSIITDISIDNPDYGQEYYINVTADDFTDCYVGLTINYIDNDGNIYSDFAYGETGASQASFENTFDYEIRDIEVNIYKNYKVVNSIIVPMGVTLGEADVDENIIIPYEFNISDGALVSSESSYSIGDDNGSFSSRSGNFTLTNVYSDEVYVEVNLIYSENGIEISVPIRKHYKFDIQYDYDYEIATYHTSGYEFVHDGTNVIPIGDDPEAIDYCVYVVNLNVIAKIKNRVLDGYDGYTLNITKGGKKSGEDGNDYYVAGANTSGYSIEGYYEAKNILMLHDLEYEDGSITAIKSAELEFNINGGQTHRIEYVIPTYAAVESLYNLSGLDTLNSFDWVTVDNGLVNMTITTGFDSETNPNYCYKVKVMNGSNVVAESQDYETASSVTFEGLEESDRGYDVYITTYYYDGSRYINLGDTSLGMELFNVAATFTNVSEIQAIYGGKKQGTIKINANALQEGSSIAFTINPDNSSYTATDSISLDDLPTSKSYVYNYFDLNITDSRDTDGIITLVFSADSDFAQYLESVELSVVNVNGDTKTATI